VPNNAFLSNFSLPAKIPLQDGSHQWPIILPEKGPAIQNIPGIVEKGLQPMHTSKIGTHRYCAII
jgi:hypothetical protein